METEDRNEDQLHKPFRGEFILISPERWSRKKTGDLGHMQTPSPAACRSREKRDIQYRFNLWALVIKHAGLHSVGQ